MLENGNKIRLIKILEILKKETDDDHSISTNQIAEMLLDMGINSNRKTLYSDLEVLSESYDIVKDKSNKNFYHMGERDFDPTEIQIIISALMTAGFISEDKTIQLIDKFKNTLSKYQADDICKNVKLKDVMKHTNESILYNLSSIMDAINKNKKINFKYFHYNLDKTKMISSKREATPLDLLYNNNFYYVVAFDEEKDKIITFRLDKMLEVNLSDIDATPVDYNSALFIKSFNMYQGTPKRITLRVHKDIMDPVLDKFGENIISMPTPDATHALISVEVQISKTFFSWLVSLGDKIEIFEPLDLRNEFKNFLLEIVSKY